MTHYYVIFFIHLEFFCKHPEVQLSVGTFQWVRFLGVKKLAELSKTSNFYISELLFGLQNNNNAIYRYVNVLQRVFLNYSIQHVVLSSAHHIQKFCL